MGRKKKLSSDILEYQPDGVEIEERPVPGRIRWVLYVILFSIVTIVLGAIYFQVDRIVVADGNLITTTPTIIVQPLNTAAIRSVEVQVGDLVEEGQLLATLDATFASADLSQLEKQRLTLDTQIRRIRAELNNKKFSALAEEGEDGRLQEQLFRQRRVIFNRNRQLNEEKVAALRSKQKLNQVQREGQEKQLKLLRDVEGTTAKLPQTGNDYRLRLLEAQKSRHQATNDIDRLLAEGQVIVHELKQVQTEWIRYVEELAGELMEQEVQLRSELEKITEEILKAKRLHELVSLRAPQQGIVLSIAERSVGSIIQQAEPLITMVPAGSNIEVEVNVQPKDIGRIRTGDTARIKLDAFPFQRHDTLPGEVRVISENAFHTGVTPAMQSDEQAEQPMDGFYRARIKLLATQLRNVPDGFRIMPGMKVRAEIKIGTRTVISYFLYPIIRAFDESLREP